MNKWEDSFKKMSVENGNQMCHCSNNQGLFVPNRQLSTVVAITLLLAFSIFMTGYFLGKRKAVEQFAQTMQQEAVADKIYTTMLLTSAEALAKEDRQADTLVMYADDTIIASATINQEMSETPIVMPQDVSSDVPSQKYYAQLIGFGTEKAAQAFTKKLFAKGIETEVKKRSSKTVKGHTSYWYQVVTAQYAHKDDLLHLVDKLTKEENIKDARICIC
jgi:hypothetical protein